jgi:hypothetical protein
VPPLTYPDWDRARAHALGPPHRTVRAELPHTAPTWSARLDVSRGLEAGACHRRLNPLGGSGVRRCPAVPDFIPKLERQHQLNARAYRSLALHSRSLVSRLRPLRSATVSRCLSATMGRSDLSTGIRALASRLSRVASGKPSSPDPLRSPSVTSRSLPIMPTAPTVQDLVLGFRSGPHRRPPARPSPVRFRSGLIFASGPSPSASRPAAAFGYRGISRHTSPPGRTSTSWIETLRGARTAAAPAAAVAAGCEPLTSPSA